MKIKTQPTQRSCCQALTQCPKTFRILCFVAILGNQVQKSCKKNPTFMNFERFR